VDVPYWRTPIADWVLATDPASRGRDKRVPVHFGNDRNEAILVDFSGGRSLVYEKAVGKVEDKNDPTKMVDKTVNVRDSSAQEAVILSAEGKLIALNSVVDEETYTPPKQGEKEEVKNLTRGQERDKRLQEWRERIKDVKEGKTHEKEMRPGAGGGDGRGGSPGGT